MSVRPNPRSMSGTWLRLPGFVRWNTIGQLSTAELETSLPIGIVIENDLLLPIGTIEAVDSNEETQPMFPSVQYFPEVLRATELALKFGVPVQFVRGALVETGDARSMQLDPARTVGPVVIDPEEASWFSTLGEQAVEERVNSLLDEAPAFAG